MDVNELVALPDDKFRGVVDEAVRTSALTDEVTLEQRRHVQELLKRPELADRTYLVLVAMKKNVEGQLAAKRTDNQRRRVRLQSKPDVLAREEDEYRRWRAGALRFKTGVEEFMVELRSKRVGNATEVALRGERNDLVFAYERLRKGILEHRDHVCSDTCDAGCPADERLWELVNHG
jgi:hypothetical protein